MKKVEIDALNVAQADPAFHPYTCRNNSGHAPLKAGWIGWICTQCTYFQPYSGKEVFS